MATVSRTKRKEENPPIPRIDKSTQILETVGRVGYTFIKSLPHPYQGCVVSKDRKKFILKVTPLQKKTGKGQTIAPDRGEALIQSLPPHPGINAIVQRYFYREKELTNEKEKESEYVLDLSPYIEGKELFEELVETEKPFPVEKAIQYAIEVGEAISFLHANGVAYRDLKPENLIRDGSQIKIVDMEFARRIQDEPPMSPVGTENFCPPEYDITQLSKGNKYLDRVDSFAFGVTLFIFLTGSPPYTTKERLQYIAQGTPIPHINPETIPDPKLLKLIQCLMERDPEKRMTVTEATNELKKFQQKLLKPQPTEEKS